jgi:FtsP/CotA-like multicopper oxidase with cupredoxin domain
MGVGADGKLADPESGGDLGTLFGREGNTVLANGRVAPTLLARPGLRQRWRIVNAAKSRYFQLAIAGHAFTRIGGDGGLLPAAQESATLVLTPGERADVLVTPNGAPGTVLPVRWVPYDRGFGSTEFRPEEVVLLLGLTDDAPVTAEEQAALPVALRSIPPLQLGAATSRALSLTQDTVDGKLVLGVNGLPAWEAPALHARVGDTELWTITNDMDWDHPFHLHGYFFQPVDPLAGPPFLVPEWKDTLNVPRRQTVALAVRFEGRPGMWMFHCHILDHAEAGMMGMIHVEP